MNSDELLQLQQLIFYSNYYFPAEIYNYRMNGLEKYKKGITSFMPGPIVTNTLDRIADEISYINHCLIYNPYVLIIQLKEIKNDTLINLETGKIYKFKYLKGKILKNVKDPGKSYSDTNFVYFNAPGGGWLEWGHEYNTELFSENINVNYSIANNIKGNNIYLVFLRLKGRIYWEKDKYKPYVPLTISGSMNHTHGMFEVRDDKLIDAYNFFRMGREPNFNDILNYLNNTIKNIEKYY